MDKSKNNIEDFLKDEFFVQWVLKPSDESNYYWQQWLSHHPEQRNLIQNARQIIKSLHYSAPEELNQNEKDQMLSHLVAYFRKEKEKSLPGKVGVSFLQKYAAAAAIIILSVVTISLIYFSDLNQNGVVTTETAPQWVSKTVPFGQKNIIKFVDGSEAKLNSGSKISFISGFEPDKRVVSLQGEAFFEIAEDESRPFYIQSGEVLVRVTGTSFNVRAFQDENELKVAVVSGTVEVSTTNGKQTKLKKNEMAVYNHQLKSIELTSYNYKTEIAWKDGKLIFSDNNLNEVLEKLQRWYGVEVILQDDDVKGIYNGEYENASLEMVLEGVSFAYDLDYEIKGNTVELK